MPASTPCRQVAKQRGGTRHDDERDGVTPLNHAADLAVNDSLENEPKSRDTGEYGQHD
jgi:hypothetical protein